MSLTTPFGRAPFEPTDRHSDVTLPQHVVELRVDGGQVTD